MNASHRLKSGAAALLAFAVTAGVVQAQDRPGIDRPIRVGMFRGIGGSVFWHTNVNTATTVLGQILASPATAGLGDSLAIPPAGFVYYPMPVAQNSAGTDCTGVGCGPTPAQLDSIVASLDTLDVLVMNSNTNIGGRIASPVHRDAFQIFWATKGLVSVHQTIDTYGSWPMLDSVQGARFRGHPSEQNGQVRRDSVFASEPSWRFLNRGVFPNGVDTTFFEEWLYFMESGSTIRSRPHLKPTMVFNEASIANPGSQVPMGDHPMSWYRELPAGGRVFYTALGHRSQVWQTTRTFRRQIYNAILWTAKYDSLSQVAGLQPRPDRLVDFARLSLTGSSLAVSVLEEGPHRVELLALNGRILAARRGAGRSEHAFAGLAPGIHFVAVTTPAGRQTRKVMVK